MCCLIKLYAKRKLYILHWARYNIRDILWQIWMITLWLVVFSHENKAITSTFSFKLIKTPRYSKRHTGHVLCIANQIDILFMNVRTSIFCYYNIVEFSVIKTIIFETVVYILAVTTIYHLLCDGRERILLNILVTHISLCAPMPVGCWLFAVVLYFNKEWLAVLSSE